METKTAKNLSMSVQYLKGVGPARAKLFNKLGVETLADLLEHFPRDWDFMPEIIKMNKAHDGAEAAVVGIIESTNLKSYRRPAIFEAVIADETACLNIVWFNGA